MQIKIRQAYRRNVVVAAVLAAILAVAAHSVVGLASTAPGLGKATSFAILAGTTVTNNKAPSTTLVTGDLGISAGTAVTNMAGHLIGTQHTGSDPLAISAKNDLTAAYGVAKGSPCNFNKTGQNLGGLVLTPGTYCQTTAPTLTGTLTLSGNGVFIFQAGGTLVTAPGATVRLINGAQPCNVFWQVSSSATLDTTTTFVGTILAQTSISLNNGATITGRALAQTGGVTLINNQITAPGACNAATVAGPTASPAPRLPASGAPAITPHGAPWVAIAVTAGLLGILVSAAVRVRRQRP